MRPKVLYLHGANASPDNFNYYKLVLPEHDFIAPMYDMDEDPFDVVDSLNRKVKREFGDSNIIVVGHSFGGLIGAWYSAINPKRVNHLVTIATPWQGTPVARIFGYFFRNSKMFKNIRPGAEVLSLLQQKTFSGAHTNIVCTHGGNPVAGMGSQANDGMVSVDSQSSVPPNFVPTENVYIEAGHSGVLLNNSVTTLLQKVYDGESTNGK